jgi:hypothetical protein
VDVLLENNVLSFRCVHQASNVIHTLTQKFQLPFKVLPEDFEFHPNGSRGMMVQLNIPNY